MFDFSYLSACPYLSALLATLPGGEGAPLKVEVALTASDEVMALRDELSKLRSQFADMKQDFNRTEYRYRCEVMLNLQLQDILRQAGVPFPKRLCTTGETELEQ